MAITRIKNNQITDASGGNVYLGVNASAKLQDYTITAGKIANNLTYGSDLTITGNLTVNGNTTTVDTHNLVVEDPLILLAKEQTGSPALDIGFIGKRGTSDNIAWIWDESLDEFAAVFTTDENTNTVVTISAYASIKSLDLAVTGNLTVTGTTGFTGNITSANVTGNVNASNFLTPGVVSATGNVTGGNLVTGGILTATGNVIGGNINTSGDMSATANIYGGNIISGNAVIGNINVSGDITVNSLTSNTYVSATGNVIGGNVSTAGLVTATGNVTGGNINTGGLVTATGNVTGGNLVTGGLATVTGNITGGNLLTSGLISATGNLDSGNVNTGIVNATGNVDSANVNTGIVSATGNVIAPNVVTGVVTTSSGDLILNSAGGSLQWDGTGNIVLNGQWINNLGSPVASTDAATKQYVDDAVSTGITIHTPVYLEAPVSLPAATYAQGGNTFTVNQTIAGNTVVFSTAANVQPNDQLWFTTSFEGIVANIAYFVVSAPNTSSAILSTTYGGQPVSNITSNASVSQSVRVNSGQGATLTGNTNAALSVDGVAVSTNDRILVYNQTPAYENGVYVVTQSGNISAPFILTRSADTNTYIPGSINGLDAGDYFYVQAGNTGAGESYVMTAPVGPFVIGYNSLTFTQFSASQVYTANTSAGLSLNGTVFSAKVDNETTAFDGGGNISVKVGANLTTPNIGNAVGNSLTLTGTGNIDAANLILSGLATVTGNVTGGNINTGGLVTATGNVIGGNVSTAGLVTATGNVTGGNINTGGAVSATGNVDSGNVNTGIVSATGNVIGANLETAGLVTATGNVIGGNVSTAGLVTATGNITGGNINTGGAVSATGNVDSGNVNTTIVSATGNVIGANVSTAGLISATGNIYGSNLILSTGIIDGPASGLITVNGSNADVDFAVNGDTTANILYIDAGTGTASFGTSTQTTGAIVAFNTADSILIPTGNIGQRPGTGVTGMLRFNTSLDTLEFYDNDSWQSAGTTFTIITADPFTGDGSTLSFTLSEDSTTAATIVSINGVVQIPTTAYSVSGNLLTFTEAPAVSDIIDARILVTTTSVKAITNVSGNASVEVSDANDSVQITGDLIPSANVTYDIGSNTMRWNDAYFNGTTITLGNVQIKNSTGTTIGFFGPDGTTPATIDSTNIDTTTISNGTSNMAVVASNGNITATVSGQGIISITSAGITNNQGNGVGNIGNSTGYFNTVFAKATSAQYADLAEMYEADQIIEPGTVVCFGGVKEITVCSEESSKRVAGVVSTNPSYIMNAGLSGDCVVAVALTGRVPTKVTGSIRKGDMLVSAGDGRARADANPTVGSVIGKALADFDGADGVIEVVVGRL